MLSGETIKKPVKEKAMYRPAFHPLTKTEILFIKILRTISILSLFWGICSGYDEIENIVVALMKNEYYWDQWFKGLFHCFFYLLLSFGLWKLAKKAEFRDVEEYNKAKQDNH